jgi:hypothetical protein
MTVSAADECELSFEALAGKIARVKAKHDHPSNPTDITSYITGSHELSSDYSERYERNEYPIWTCGRMGMSTTRLADGRIVCIGGEYEDFYDPDFFIYNDVLVFDGDNVTIYGYPTADFPPTDSHEAISIGDKIWIVGCLGYVHQRDAPRIQLCCLDLSTMQIKQVETTGEAPGWMSFDKSDIGWSDDSDDDAPADDADSDSDDSDSDGEAKKPANKCLLGENYCIVVRGGEGGEWKLDTESLVWTKTA